jgi:hypothetical protein
MVILNGNPTTLQGNDGEIITVSVVSSGTVPQVALSLNDAPLPSSSFPLNKTIANPFTLVVAVAYSQDNGGTYVITLTGSGGGDTSVVTLTQAPNQTDDAVAYTIAIV